MHNLKELKIWNKSFDLATEVYHLTANIAEGKKYALTSQIRRSAISLPSNTAEGAGPNTSGEFNRFLGISNGSAYELQTQLILSENLELIDGSVDRFLMNLIRFKNDFSLQNKLTHK
jgi:four helix bundle protein